MSRQQLPANALLAWRPSAPPLAVETIDELVVLARALREHVLSWPSIPPTQEAKSATIQDILQMRAQASKLAESYGRSLVSPRR